jgi:hypothetical protein
MATEQVSEKLKNEPMIKPALLGWLAIHQYQLDKAAGVRRVTPQVASLLGAYNKLVRKDVQRAINASVAHALLQQDQKRMLEIMSQVEEADLEQKREFLAEAEKLQARTEQYVKALNRIKATS